MNAAPGRAGSHAMFLGPVIAEEHAGPNHPMTSRVITLVLAGGPHPIGALIHRGYDSGYPQPYEVWVNGNGSYDFYPDEPADERGAAQFAAAAARILRRPEGFSLKEVPRPYAARHPRCPTCQHPLPSTEETPQ